MAYLYYFIKSCMKGGRFEYFIRLLRDIIVPYEKRYLNKDFWQYYELLVSAENKDLKEVEEYQLKELKRIVSLVFENSVFYRKKYLKSGFTPDRLKTLKDISLIPVLSRDEIKENLNLMLTKSGGLKRVSTAGTSGSPLAFYHDQKAIFREWAAVCYIWRSIGYKPGEGRIEFRGIVEGERLYDYQVDHRLVRVNVSQINEGSVHDVLNVIDKSGYRYLHGYPSAIYNFLKVVHKVEAKSRLNVIKGIMFASEIVYDFQKEFIEKEFMNIKLHDFYGMAERVVIAHNPTGSKFEIVPSYGIAEVDKDGAVIATGLINEAMPLIRYQLTDLITEPEFSPNDNGTIKAFTKVEGRIGDVILDTSGNEIPPAMLTFCFKTLELVEKCKIIYYKYSKRYLVLVEGPDTHEIRNECNIIIISLISILGKDAKVEYELIKKIELGKTGKFKWIEAVNA